MLIIARMAIKQRLLETRSMPRFAASLRNWGSDAFAKTLKDEIESLNPGVLPLAKGTSQGGLVDEADLTATVINSAAKGAAIQAKVGIFFSEVVAGCSCGDEPMSVHAYCEIQVSIDKETAETDFTVLPRGADQ